MWGGSICCDSLIDCLLSPPCMYGQKIQNLTHLEARGPPNAFHAVVKIVPKRQPKKPVGPNNVLDRTLQIIPGLRYTRIGYGRRRSKG